MSAVFVPGRKYCAWCQWGRCDRCEGDYGVLCCCGRPLRRSSFARFDRIVSGVHGAIREVATSDPRHRLPKPARLAELRAMPYKRYLRTAEWRERRAERVALIERCEWCEGEEKELRRTGGLPFNVHHLTYERVGAEQWDDLVLLCSPCHRKAHGLDTKGEPEAEEAV